MTSRLPDFLVVGTPRSGTTLVQRLASELPGVVVPPETHFFTEFAPDLLRRRTIPLTGEELRGEIERYRARPYLEGVALDPGAVFDALGGTCRSLLELYGAVLGQLADAPVVGEKTPGHLLWWAPLSGALPHLVLVAVVRDPRAVVSSQRALGWGGHPVVAARRWLDDVDRVLAAQAALGPRCLVLRFEDLVADPAASRAKLAAALGLADGAAGPGPSGASPALFPAWETWKEGAVGEVDPGRADAWRGKLSDVHAAQIVAVCRRGMVALGYDEPLSARDAARARRRLPPGLHLRLLRARVARRRREAGIRRLARSLTGP